MAAPRAQWSGRTITLASPEDYAQEFQEFLQKGAIHVGGQGLPAPLEEFAFELVLPSGERLSLRGMITATTGVGALVQLLHFDAALVDRLRPPEPSLPPEERPLNSGTIVNPDGFAELTALPLGLHVEMPPDLGAPLSTAALFRAIGIKLASGWLTVRGGEEVDQRMPVDKGVFFLADADREAIRRVFRLANGSWTFEDGTPEKEPGRKPISPLHLVLDGARACLREFPLDHLRAEINLRAGVKLRPSYQELAPFLFLTIAEKRLVEELDGRRSLAAIVADRGMIAEPLLIRLVALLAVLRVVEFTSPRPTR